jgi:hypothetical protein
MPIEFLLFAWSDDLQCLVGTTKGGYVCFLSYNVFSGLQDLLGFDIIPDFSGWNPFLIPDTGYPNALAPHTHTQTYAQLISFPSSDFYATVFSWATVIHKRTSLHSNQSISLFCKSFS